MGSCEDVPAQDMYGMILDDLADGQHLAGLLHCRHRPPATRAVGTELVLSRQRPPEPGAGPAVEGYLAEFTARLP